MQRKSIFTSTQLCVLKCPKDHCTSQRLIPSCEDTNPSSHWFDCKALQLNQSEVRMSRGKGVIGHTLRGVYRNLWLGGQKHCLLDFGDGLMDGLSNVVDVLGGQTAHVDAPAGHQVHVSLFDHVLHLFGCDTQNIMSVVSFVLHTETLDQTMTLRTSSKRQQRKSWEQFATELRGTALLFYYTAENYAQNSAVRLWINIPRESCQQCRAGEGFALLPADSIQSWSLSALYVLL